MRLRLLGVLLPAALWLLPSDAVAQPFGNSYLVVAPYEGHPGATVNIAGSGFPPGSKSGPITITIACPQMEAGASISLVRGPVPDAHGNFVGFRFSTPNLPVTDNLPCKFYAQDGINPLGPDIKPTYFIVPRGTPLVPCAQHICGVHVQTSPVKAHSGQIVRISIADKSWPGAAADIQIQYGNRPPTRKTVVLNVHGNAALQIPAAVRVDQGAPPATARVRVRLHMGATAGSGVTHFTVVH